MTAAAWEERSAPTGTSTRRWAPGRGARAPELLMIDRSPPGADGRTWSCARSSTIPRATTTGRSWRRSTSTPPAGPHQTTHTESSVSKAGGRAMLGEPCRHGADWHGRCATVPLHPRLDREAPGLPGSRRLDTECYGQWSVHRLLHRRFQCTTGGRVHTLCTEPALRLGVTGVGFVGPQTVLQSSRAWAACRRRRQITVRTTTWPDGHGEEQRMTNSFQEHTGSSAPRDLDVQPEGRGRQDHDHHQPRRVARGVRPQGAARRLRPAGLAVGRPGAQPARDGPDRSTTC